MPARPLRIAVHLQPIQSSNTQTDFRAALPMGVLFEKNLDQAELAQARRNLESAYSALVTTVRDLRTTLDDRNVLRYWFLGDAIITFEEHTKNSLLFVDQLTAQLARDVGYSKSMLDLCRRFRYKFPDSSQLDSTLPFDAYHRSGFDLQRAANYRRK